MKKYRKVSIKPNELETFYIESILRGLDYNDEILRDSWLHSNHPNHTVHTDTLYFNSKKNKLYYIISNS